MLQNDVVCPGPVSRREFLRVGALGLGGMTVADLLRLRASANESQNGKSPVGSGTTTNTDTAVIFVWLPGGPPHMEMYDMKPEAPSDYRGALHSIPTNVPGLDVCELMPQHAKLADKYSIVRSIAHEFADHGGGHKRFLTARIPKSPVDTVNDNPMAGGIIAKCREDRMMGVPNYVNLADGGREGVDVFAFGSAYLGPSYVPFAVPGDPTAPNFTVPNIAPLATVTGRLDDRLRLLNGFDQMKRAAESNGLMSSMDQFNKRALDLLTHDKARVAFDLSKEPEELRQRYGKHAWGSRMLMARRLVEAGSSFVTVLMENPYQSGVAWLKQGTYNWDSHAVNCHMYDDLRVRLPIYDQAVTALIEDLYARGLDKRVLLVVTGEFGRTPRLESTVGSQTGVKQPGRDHWPQAMSLLVSGGGLRMGQVIGSTNSKGEHPKDCPLTPNDLWATVYQHMGIDPERTFPDYQGRPMPILPFGKPIRGLS